jgi:hypothetical protein
VAQAFDLAHISNTVGALSFAHFAKGGSRECLRKWFDHTARGTTPNGTGSIATHPCNKREDGAPSVGMAYTVIKGGPPAPSDEPIPGF